VRLERPPQAIVSSIMHLSEGLAQQLAARYGCPVFDLYALTEAGIVGVRTPHGHAILPHDLYVEILDEHDQPCPHGTRGEITLTGGRNPFLPLLRYRTGDFASLAWHEARAALVGLEGRQPVCFPCGDAVVHSMEVTRLLRPFSLTQYQLQQDDVGGFRFRYRGAAPEAELRETLHHLLGKPQQLVVEELPPTSSGPRKLLVYESRHPHANLLTRRTPHVVD
jgi:phenylacetate-CoA ligase